MLESVFQKKIIDELKESLPGVVITKTNSAYLPGIPDLLILYEDRWALLEIKKTANARQQPNQAYYVDKMNSMSFAAFIYPENKGEVLDALLRSLRSER